MAKLNGTHYVISAVSTDTGAPTYRTPTGAWVRSLQEAATYETDEEMAEQLQVAEREQRLVCDPYSFRVSVGEGLIDPLTTRERIRAEGPTTRIRRPD